MSSCALQKSSETTSAAEYKKTDAPQPDVKEEAEEEEAAEEEEEAKEEESGLINHFCSIFHTVKCDQSQQLHSLVGRVSFYCCSSRSVYTLLSFWDLGLDHLKVELFSIILCCSLRSKEE